MHQVVTAQLARRRAGTQSTKTRAEVRGGGAKPYRQKGTGNARQGSNRAPHFSGGGVALGPKPRELRPADAKKMIRLAAALGPVRTAPARARSLVVDALGLRRPEDQGAEAALGGARHRRPGARRRRPRRRRSALSFRNLPEVQLIQPGELNAYDVLCNDWIVFTSANLVVDQEEHDDGSPSAAGRGDGERPGSQPEGPGAETRTPTRPKRDHSA